MDKKKYLDLNMLKESIENYCMNHSNWQEATYEIYNEPSGLFEEDVILDISNDNDRNYRSKYVIGRHRK